MKLIFEESIAGHGCSILPQCDVPLVTPEEKNLRKDKSTPEEIMLEEVDNMINIIERYLENQKK